MNNTLDGAGKYTWNTESRSTEGKWKLGKKIGEHLVTTPTGRERLFFNNEGKLTKKGILMPTY